MYNSFTQRNYLSQVPWRYYCMGKTAFDSAWPQKVAYICSISVPYTSSFSFMDCKSPAIAHHPHAGRRTAFQVRQNEGKFKTIEISITPKYCLFPNHLFLWNGFMNPLMQSLVNFFFCQPFKQLFSRKKSESSIWLILVEFWKWSLHCCPFMINSCLACCDLQIFKFKFVASASRILCKWIYKTFPLKNP